MDKLFEVGVMGQTTGQSYRSKSRPAEYFVNRCYWQYQFMLRVGEKRRVEGKKSRAEERRITMHQYLLVAEACHYQCALCTGVHTQKCPFHVKVPFSQILYHVLFGSWGKNTILLHLLLLSGFQFRS